ncbi:hypothetical protein ACF0H5_012230 [Mactra antiquata]
MSKNEKTIQENVLFLDSDDSSFSGFEVEPEDVNPRKKVKSVVKKVKPRVNIQEITSSYRGSYRGRHVPYNVRGKRGYGCGRRPSQRGYGSQYKSQKATSIITSEPKKQS